MRRNHKLESSGKTGMHPLKWSSNWDSSVPFSEVAEMPGKQGSPEEIVLKLRHVGMSQGQGGSLADSMPRFAEGQGLLRKLHAKFRDGLLNSEVCL